MGSNIASLNKDLFLIYTPGLKNRVKLLFLYILLYILLVLISNNEHVVTMMLQPAMSTSKWHKNFLSHI